MNKGKGVFDLFGRGADVLFTGMNASDVKDRRQADIDAYAALVRVQSNC